MLPEPGRPTVNVPLPEPEPAPLPEPEPEPTPEPVLEKETVSPEPVADSAPAQPVCSVCGAVIDNPDVAEVSEIRYGVHLCRQHFAERRNKK